MNQEALSELINNHVICTYDTSCVCILSLCYQLIGLSTEMLFTSLGGKLIVVPTFEYCYFQNGFRDSQCLLSQCF